MFRVKVISGVFLKHTLTEMGYKREVGFMSIYKFQFFVSRFVKTLPLRVTFNALTPIVGLWGSFTTTMLMAAQGITCGSSATSVPQRQSVPSTQPVVEYSLRGTHGKSVEWSVHLLIAIGMGGERRGVFYSCLNSRPPLH